MLENWHLQLCSHCCRLFDAWKDRPWHHYLTLTFYGQQQVRVLRWTFATYTSRSNPPPHIISTLVQFARLQNLKFLSNLSFFFRKKEEELPSGDAERAPTLLYRRPTVVFILSLALRKCNDITATVQTGYCGHQTGFIAYSWGRRGEREA